VILCFGGTLLLNASLILPIVQSKSFSSKMCNLVIFILIGGWIGFGYAFIGGNPIYQIINLETLKPIDFYLSTFTNSVAENVIRPSGLFDEPGALVMLSNLVVIINEVGGGSRKKSIIILEIILMIVMLKVIVNLLKTI
jgi:hypothetical protein